MWKRVKDSWLFWVGVFVVALHFGLVQTVAAAVDRAGFMPPRIGCFMGTPVCGYMQQTTTQAGGLVPAGYFAPADFR